MKHTFKTKICSITLGTMTTFSVMADKPAAAGADPFLGELMLVGGTFCPKGWANATGAILAINSYQALYSLYTTMYGGDGRSTFGVPDLQGRAPISAGQGSGLENYYQGRKGGAESFTLQTNNLAAHNHDVEATNAIANKNGPGTDFLAVTSTTQDIYHEGPPTVLMDAAMITNTGSAEPVKTRSPYATIRWCVAGEGIYPSN